MEIWWNQHRASLFYCYKCWVHSSFFFCRKTLKPQPNCTRERQKSRMAIIPMGSRSCHADVQAVTLIPLLNWLWIPNKINWVGLFIIRMKTWIMRKFSKTLNGCMWIYCFLIGFPYLVFHIEKKVPKLYILHNLKLHTYPALEPYFLVKLMFCNDKVVWFKYWIQYMSYWVQFRGTERIDGLGVIRSINFNLFIYSA